MIPAVKSSRVDEGEIKLRLSDVSVLLRVRTWKERKYINSDGMVKWIRKQTLRHELPPSQRYAKLKTEKAIDTKKQRCVLFTDSKVSKSLHGLIHMKVNICLGLSTIMYVEKLTLI